MPALDDHGSEARRGEHLRASPGASGARRSLAARSKVVISIASVIARRCSSASVHDRVSFPVPAAHSPIRPSCPGTAAVAIRASGRTAGHSRPATTERSARSANEQTPAVVKLVVMGEPCPNATKRSAQPSRRVGHLLGRPHKSGSVRSAGRIGCGERGAMCRQGRATPAEDGAPLGRDGNHVEVAAEGGR